MSKRQHLLALARRHPEWKATKYAEILDQRVEVVRSHLSQFRQQGLITRKRVPQGQKDEPEIAQPVARKVDIQPGMTGSGRAIIRKTYLKLI